MNSTSTQDHSVCAQGESTSAQEPISAQDRQADDQPATHAETLSPRELQFAYTALGFLQTSLKVLEASHRSMITRLEADDAAHKDYQARHRETVEMLRQAFASGEAAGRAAAAMERIAGGSKPAEVVAASRRVSGRARRKRGRSPSAAG